MMSGRQWTEQKKFTIKNKLKFDEMSTIFVDFRVGPNAEEKGLQKFHIKNWWQSTQMA